MPLRLDIEGAHTKGEGTHKGCPYGWILRARTRGEGAHTGCPYPIQAASVGANGVWRRRCALGWPPTC